MAKSVKHSSRNPPLSSTVGRYSRTQMKRRRGTYHRIKAFKAKPAAQRQPAKKTPKFEVKKIGTSKGELQKRIVFLKKAQRWMPTEENKRPRKSVRRCNPTRLRPSISPGTILIIIAGKLKGQRVVFLKQLSSGLLLVTGPYSINGIPLRRVEQAYVITTSTKVNISGVTIPSDVNDDYFKHRGKKKQRQGAKESLISKETSKFAVTQEMNDKQKAIDAPIIKNLKQIEYFEGYLKSKFSLSKGVFPHELKF